MDSIDKNISSMVEAFVSYHIEEKFKELRRTFREETGHFSILEEQKNHPACQEIISMGDHVIPLILEDIRQERYHTEDRGDRAIIWDLVLRDMTGKGVMIPEEEWGNIQAIEDSWIAWGIEEGYIDEK